MTVSGLGLVAAVLGRIHHRGWRAAAGGRPVRVHAHRRRGRRPHRHLGRPPDRATQPRPRTATRHWSACSWQPCPSRCSPTTSASCGSPSRPPRSRPRSSSGTRHPEPLEAAWKYVVLGSVGVAIAFLGIVLLYAATAGRGTPDRCPGSCSRRRRPAARPGAGHGRRRARRPRLRDQGGPGAHAQLAAGRAQPGTRAGLRADVRRAAVGGLLRHPAGPGRHRRRRSGPG